MDADFEGLKRRIADVKGFDCSEYRESFLRRRIEIRMRATGMATLRDYVSFLDRNPGEYALLVEALTIHITRFFRDEDVFSFLAGNVLSELLWEKKKSGRKVIRIWSAGCASGEEAYSIAILFSEFLDLKLNDFFISIIGTDVDPDCISKAESGVFPSGELVDVRRDYIERYFSYIGAGKCRISPQLRRLVKFSAHDFMSPARQDYFDMIFCRNAMIYLDDEKQRQLFGNFYRALKPGGFLVLGTTESVLGEASRLFSMVSSKYHVYRRLDPPS